MESLSSFLTGFSAAWDPRMYDLLTLLLVLITALHGAFRGLIKEAATTISIAMSYVLASPLGKLSLLLPPFSSIPSFFRKPLALTVGGILGYILTSITLAILIRMLGWRRRKWKGVMKYVIHGGGALIGGLFGFLLIMIISWYILWVGALTDILFSPEKETATPPRAGETIQAESGTLSGVSVMNHREGIQKSLIGNFAEKTMPVPERVTTQTKETIKKIMEIAQDQQRMQKIVQDASIQDLLKSAAVQRLLKDKEVGDLAREKNVMGLLANPTLRSVFNDPEVAEKLQKIDILKLINADSSSSLSSASSDSSVMVRPLEP